MVKLKKIGGLLFRKTASGLKYAGYVAKTGHGLYKQYKAGETKRLGERLEKERLKASIRRYKSQYKPKSRTLKELKSLFK